MGTTLKQKLATLPAKRQRRVKARASQLVAEELSLQDLRKALDQTQTGVARILKVGQDTVSRYERQSDMLLSTLRSYIAAMGGELSLVAEFPERPPIKIRALGDISSAEKRVA